MMKSKPLLSVIFPCYNASKYLNESLSSILNQSFSDFELIIIDDGSKDDSYSICEDYKQSDNRIKLFKNDANSGVVFTLNKGIDLAEGEFIARMDADDISDLNRFQKQIDYLKANPKVAILGTKAQAIDLSSNKLPSISTVYLTHNTINFSAHFTQPLFHGSVLGRAIVFKENKYGKSSKAEDFELWLRLISKGLRIENLSETLYFYRINPESVSQQNETQQIKDHNEISNQYLKANYNLEEPEEIINLLNNRPLNLVSYAQVKQALNCFQQLFSLQNSSKQELKKYYIRQQVDILIQAYKMANNNFTKAKILVRLIMLTKEKVALLYLKSKLKKSNY